MKANSRRIRVGIDVGGTFTKAVAIDMIKGKIIDKVTVPTSHSSKAIDDALETTTSKAIAAIIKLR